MATRSHVSPLKRWLESILVWYILFIILYLIFRFAIQSSWRFILFINNLAPYFFGLVVIGLVIALLLRSRRLIGLYLLVTLIGGLWIGATIAPPLSTTLSNEGTQIDIVSFNAFPDNDDLSTMIAWLDARNPAIIALQDLPEASDDLSALDDTHEYSARQVGRSANVVYSQYPITDSADIDLAHSIAQRLVLDIEGQSVVLYNVHLFMPLNARETQWAILRYDENRRNEDVERLLALIAEETLPVIVTGDFNLTEWSPIYSDITAELTDSYRMMSWGIGATWPAGASEEFGGGYPRLFRLDYVWVSDELEVASAIVGSPLGSDHLPLRVELILP